MGLRGPKIGSHFKKTEEKRIARERIRAFVDENLDPIMSAMKDKAVGCKVVDKKSGDVFDLPPDPNAARLLIEQAYGKAVEKREISGPEGEPVRIDLSDPKVQEVRERFEEEMKQTLLED